MAGCYHDKQDFESDLNIEVAREGDILKEGQDLKDIKCKKNPGHRDFIPFKDLTLEHLPNEDRNRENLDNIKMMGSRVVRLVVEKIKNGRKRRETGSGCVIKLHNEYFISTNNHVVKTEDEVKQCTVEFHYDDDNRSSVFTSRGMELALTCPYRDIANFKFHPVPDFLHELDIMDESSKSASIVIMFINNEIETVITWPESHPSEFTCYCSCDLNSSLIHLMFLSCQDGSISYMKSPYFTFQPIPSNRQVELISIEIHIDDDDGNSRVISGDVVKFGGEFVVKISEPIFQDEVKKCGLVRNGEVSGHGTRLYFEQVKSSVFYGGVDLDLYKEQGEENYWLFGFYPIPRYIEDMQIQTKHSNNMCCIGHPHSGIKMVTFGQLVEEATERFDDQYRRIAAPGPDCQCEEVTCVKYFCKTCPGSSGSPVFLLYEGMNCGNIYTCCHFMGERVLEMFDGKQIENINIAWYPKS